MKILLTRDVDKLGQAGDEKIVANGYARNYLIPQGLAVVATAGALKQSQTIRRSEERRQATLADGASVLAEALEKVTLTFPVRASEAGKLYGSITTKQIVTALESETGLTIDKRKLDIRESIRNVGLYTIRVHLARDLNPHFNVLVENEATAGSKQRDLPSEDEEAAVEAAIEADEPTVETEPMESSAESDGEE